MAGRLKPKRFLTYLAKAIGSNENFSEVYRDRIEATTVDKSLVKRNEIKAVLR